VIWNHEAWRQRLAKVAEARAERASAQSRICAEPAQISLEEYKAEKAKVEIQTPVSVTRPEDDGWNEVTARKGKAKRV
jgi:hypothetical protein